MRIAMPHPGWPGWTRDGTLLLPIPAESWAPPAHGIQLDGIDFAPKRELHVTLIGRALGRRLRNAIDRETLAFTDVRGMFAAQDWSVWRTGAYLLLRKYERTRGRSRVAHSVIELLQMPAMAGFHHALAGRLHIEVEVPPPHVTLYIAGTRQGIGVPTMATLRSLGQRSLEASELPAARIETGTICTRA